MTEWKKVKLGEVGNTYTGLSGKTKEDFGHGKAKYIPYINIFNNTFVDISALEDIEVDEKQNCVQKGDVFFTTSSETPEEVGMSSVLLQDVENTYLNSFCFGYRPEKIFDSVFLAFMLRSDLVRKQFKILAQGISRFNISKTKVMEDILIFVPPIEEQQKIAEILSTQDKVIELKQKLIDEKKRQKKYLMQNLLTGRIRLKGFEGEWEKVKLEEIFLSINSGKSVKNEENGIYSIYGSTGEIGKANSYDYDEDIIIVARVGANAGSVYKICNKCKISDNALLIRINEKNSFLFIFYLLCQINLHNLVFGSGQPLVTSGYIKKILTYIPIIEEQTAIAEILSTQDKEIELLEKQLEQEKLKKKALMQLLLTGKIRVA